MGQTVLTYQFIAGLKPKSRLKVAGNGGTFELFLLKQAKLHELQPDSRVIKQTMERNQQRSPIQETQGAKLNASAIFVD